MKRKELLKSKEYWIAKIQLDLFEMINLYLKENNVNQKQLAEKLNVSKGYISQILNGNFDHKISKLVELSLALDKIPKIQYENVDFFILKDELNLPVTISNEVFIEWNYSSSKIENPINNDNSTVINFAERTQNILIKAEESFVEACNY